MDEIKKVESVSDVQFKIHDSDVNIINIKPSLKEKKETTSANDLTRFQKICFGLAGLPYQAYFCAIGVFTTVYLLNNACLPPNKTTFILFISRITDAITDPIYGLLVNKTKLTRFGKMKPWIAAAIPLCSIAYIMMWYSPAGFTENQLFVWYTFWHSFQFTAITGIRIPHTSMTMYLSHSKKERESITVYRMGFEMIGLLLALIIQGPFVSGASNCANLNETQSNSTDTNYITLSNWDQYKYTYIAIVMTVIFLAGSLPVVLYVNEKPELVEASEKNENKKKKISTVQELKRMFTFKPYLLIICSTIMTTSSIQIIQSNLQLYFEFGYIAIKDLFIVAEILNRINFGDTDYISTDTGCAIMFVPIWKKMMMKIEKTTALIIGNLTMIPLLIGVFFFKTNNIGEIITFFALAILGANCFTAAFLVPPALIPEALDSYFLKYRTKPDALFYTFFTIGTKILIAIYLGISQEVLSVVGYDITATTQTDQVGQSIKYLIAPLPLIFLLLSSVCIYFYPIDSKKAEENAKIINSIHRESTQSEIYSVESKAELVTDQEKDYF